MIILGCVDNESAAGIVGHLACGLMQTEPTFIRTPAGTSPQQGTAAARMGQAAAFRLPYFTTMVQLLPATLAPDGTGLLPV